MRKGYIAIAILGVALSAVSLFFLLRTNVPSEHMPFNEDVAAMELAFINYIAKHQKAYATKDEYHERKEIFKGTMRKVWLHNAKNGSSYKLGINKYADWTKKERQSLLGYKN